MVPLEISFRSTEPVLQAIDAIFRHEAARDGVALDGSEIRHVAARAGQAGLVELWPPVVPQPEEDADPAALPVTRRRIAEPRARLADAIAATIRSWLDRGETLGGARPPDPARRRHGAGAAAQRVRRRIAARAQSSADVPVAGADRLILTEQLAVQDLVALGRFLLFPDDDLTLGRGAEGAALRASTRRRCSISPMGAAASICGTGCAAEPQTNAALRAASERLSALLARADFVPPYELYAEILGAEGGRRALLERLGPEAEDPVEEFLALTLAYEREHVPSLQGFLRWLVAGDTEVKRDFGARPRDEVRILTVHGAKGLEAPVVFLPDTMQLPKPPEPLLWTEREELPLWRPRAAFTVPFYAAEREAVTPASAAGISPPALCRSQPGAGPALYLRLADADPAEGDLLACALPRGSRRDRHPVRLRHDGADRRATDGPARDCGSPGLQTAAAGARSLGRNGISRAIAAELGQGAAAGRARPAASRSSRRARARPSRPPPRRSGASGRDRFKRGLLVHRLLQSLPELPAEEREAAARRFLALPAHALSAEEQDEIRRETLAVLDHPDFAAIFGPGSQAEVPVVGLVEGHALSGQIDRLVVDGEPRADRRFQDVAPAARRPRTEVAPVYLRQLALYRAALARIYPGHEIRCALLWTEGPRLMPISPERLAGYPP